MKKSCLSLNTKLVMQKLLLLLRHFSEKLLTGYTFLEIILPSRMCLQKWFQVTFRMTGLFIRATQREIQLLRGFAEKAAPYPPSRNLGSFSHREQGSAPTKKIESAISRLAGASERFLPLCIKLLRFSHSPFLWIILF